MKMLDAVSLRFKRLPVKLLTPVAVFLVVAVFGPWLAPYDPAQQSYSNVLQEPSALHWLGTDYLGRDMLSRIVVAARVSLFAMATVLIAALAIGVVIGSIAGYVGGVVELALISIIDIVLSLPSLIIALALIGIMGPGYWSMVIALTLAWWANYARMSRAAVAAEIHRPYIAAVRVLGASHLWIFVRHILPSVLGLVVVYASADAGALVLAIATLSFLGLGVQPPAPEWGQMLVDGLNYFEDAPRLVLIPGLALTLVVLSFNIVGEAFALQKVPQALKGRRLRKRVERHDREVARVQGAAAESGDSIAKPDDQAIYEVRNLVVGLYTAKQSIRAVDGASFAVRPGETVAIVGESGSGKTVMTLSPLGLLPEGVAVRVRGSAMAAGVDLLKKAIRRKEFVRGKNFGVIFQDPMSALNPMRRVGPQIARQVWRFTGVSRAQARRQAVSLLRRAGIADPDDRYRRYPHEMSGGMLQRAMIALALASRPRVLIADEPTTALDATVQAQILELLRHIQKEDGLAVALITHDIGVVSAMADRVLVMYAGRIAEEGTVTDVLTDPAHPYTQGLLASVPDLWAEREGMVKEIAGSPPDLSELVPGCRFAERCPIAISACRRDRPGLMPVRDRQSHRAACPVSVGQMAEAVHA